MASAQPLLPPFVRGLAALPRPQRAALFAQADATVPVPAASSLEFELKPLAGRWPALSVCTELICGLKAAKTPRLDAGHAEIIAAAAAGAAAAEEEGWAQWLVDAKNYLYVALCDEELCEAASSALLSLCASVRGGVLPTFPTLLSSLRMVFGGRGAERCQDTALALLESLLAIGEPLTCAVVGLVGTFDAELKTSPKLSDFALRVRREFAPSK